MGHPFFEHGGIRHQMQYFSSHFRQMERHSFYYWHYAQMEKTISLYFPIKNQRLCCWGHLYYFFKRCFNFCEGGVQEQMRGCCSNASTVVIDVQHCGLQGQLNQNFNLGNLAAKKGLLHLLGHRSVTFFAFETQSRQKTFWQGPLHFTRSLLRSKHMPHQKSQNDERFFMKFLELQACFSMGKGWVRQYQNYRQVCDMQKLLKIGSVRFFQKGQELQIFHYTLKEKRKRMLAHQFSNIFQYISIHHKIQIMLILSQRRTTAVPPCLHTLLAVSKYIAIYCRIDQMSNLYSNSHAYHNYHHQTSPPMGGGQKLREVYISPFKQGKQQQQRSTTQYNNSPCKFIKIDNGPLDSLPPKAVPFRRSPRNSSKDRLEDVREKSGQLKSFRNLNESVEKRDHNVRIASLEKKLYQARVDGEKWKNVGVGHEQKLRNLSEDLMRSREERQALHGQLLSLREQLEQSQRTVSRQAEQIDSLNKSLKQSKINQKSLANLKQLQNQIDSLQQKNTSLVKQNQQLTKNNNKVKGEMFKKKQLASQSQFDITKKEEKMLSLELEVRRLKEQLSKDKSQRQMLLESNLHALQKKLYDKQNEIKRISIQINCLDRRKYTSIDEVKAKKDQEIKGLRQKLDKVNKDLRQTRSKMEKTELKRIPKPPYARKIRSSQLLGATSQSQQVTFQFSSQA